MNSFLIQISCSGNLCIGPPVWYLITNLSEQSNALKNYKLLYQAEIV